MEAETPAAAAIRLLGAKAIAARCDLTTDAVWKWPKRDGGTVPARYQPTILSLARDRGIRLTPEQIIGVAPDFEPASDADAAQ